MWDTTVLNSVLSVSSVVKEFTSGCLTSARFWQMWDTTVLNSALSVPSVVKELPLAAAVPTGWD